MAVAAGVNLVSEIKGMDLAVLSFVVCVEGFSNRDVSSHWTFEESRTPWNDTDLRVAWNLTRITTQISMHAALAPPEPFLSLIPLGFKDIRQRYLQVFSALAETP